MTGVPTIVCPECSGLTHTVLRCECVSGGDQLIVDGAGYADEPYRDCRLCRGDGSVLRPCLWCGRTGVRRAELVVSVVNVDTGSVASQRIRPGRITVERGPDGVWAMPLRPVVDRLAGQVGAVDVAGLPAVGPDPDGTLVWLPRSWAPELPAAERHRIEAEALARGDHSPWRVLLGRSVPPAAPPDPGRHLGELCRVANLLHVDLVVEARDQHGRVVWDVRYELPGGTVPVDPHLYEVDLPSAVAATTVVTATARLGETGLTAPAYTVRSSLGMLPAPTVVDLAELERWLRVDLAGSPGAQVIWRNGRWWHTRLCEGDPIEELYEWDTGQVVRYVTPRLLRVTEPPDPTWWGAPIRGHECPDCRPGDRLRRCDCRVRGTDPDPDCPRCCGAGFAPGQGACPTCGDSRRIHSALTVTVTDLTRATHHLWQPTVELSTAGGRVAGEAAVRVGCHPDGTPILQLREHYRAAGLADRFGVRPEHLIRLDQPGGHPLGQDLLEGTLTGPDPDTAPGPDSQAPRPGPDSQTPDPGGDDPARRYVTRAARGVPGARLLVLARPPAAPPTVELIRLAVGLHLAVTVVACDHRRDADDPNRLHGVRWRVDVTSTASDLDLRRPWWPSVEAAVADRFAHLGPTLRDTLPTSAHQPLPAPTTVDPVGVQDPTSALRRLARRHAGQVVAARLDGTGCRFWHADTTGPRALTDRCP
ncbi:hypothetical protein [Micromonospora sp. SH-82]|uniref:hypothetical protein n=1 Tax=Micromonospora sp. SH-82 TaxID=3132938 RepID=UPI003EBCDDBC